MMLIYFKFFLIFYLTLVMYCFQISIPKKFFNFRHKRSLGFTEEVSFIQYIFGIGLPIELQQQSITIGAVAKCTYELPKNSSFFTQHTEVVSLRRKQTSVLNRWNIYDILSIVAESLGIGGKECILQAICQIAEIPFDLNHSIFEELLHLIFTPSSTSETLQNHSDNEYLAAEELGKNGVECKKVFSNCEINFVDIFTKVGSKIF